MSELKFIKRVQVIYKIGKSLSPKIIIDGYWQAVNNKLAEIQKEFILHQVISEHYEPNYGMWTATLLLSKQT